MAQEDSARSFVTRTAGAGGGMSPYAQALLEETGTRKEEKQQFTEKLELFKLAMQLQREQQMQQHQQRMEEHQIAMEQHQLRMETIGMERERIKAEQDAQKEQKENDRAAMSLYISNNLDPASMKYDEQRKALYKDPDFLRIVANKYNGGIVAQVKDLDKQHKDVYNYWSKTFEENKIKGDPRDPNILKQDEDGVPIWDKHFDSVIQQSKLDAQREYAMRVRTPKERIEETRALQSDWTAVSGGLPFTYAQAKLNVPNPKGVTAKTGFVDPKTNEFKPDPNGDMVQYTDATKKGFKSSPMERSMHEEFNASTQRILGKGQASMEQLGVKTEFGTQSISQPMEQESAKKLDLSQIGGFGVAPKQGMNVEVTGDIPLNMGSSKEATAPSGYTPKSESMGTPANEIMQSAGESKAAPFASAPSGQPNVPKQDQTEQKTTSEEPAKDENTDSVPRASTDVAPEGSINAQLKKIEADQLSRGFVDSLKDMLSDRRY